MPRKPKYEPMTVDEMSELNQQRRNTKMYRAESMELSREAISDTVSKALTHIKKNASNPKISLDDTEAVKRVVESYLSTCVADSTFPYMSHIAMALGHTTRNLDYYRTRKPDTETGRFLQQIHDITADILSENALKGSASAIPAIFLLKALYGYRESQTIEVVTGSQSDDSMSVDDIAARAGLLD